MPSLFSKELDFTNFKVSKCNLSPRTTNSGCTTPASRQHLSEGGDTGEGEAKGEASFEAEGRTTDNHSKAESVSNI